MTSEAREVCIVDDDGMVRRSLARLIASAGHRVRTYASARELLEDRANVLPGCLLLDVRLPDLDGLELFQRMQALEAYVPVIFLTGYGDIPMSVRAMKSGAYDFLTKPVEEAALLEAIAGALAEEARVRAGRVESEELSRRYDTLTRRESEVMQLVLAGHLNKQIARELGISEKTVKVHRSRVMSKMGARRVANLVQYAMQLGVDASGARPPAGAPPAITPMHHAPGRSVERMAEPPADPERGPPEYVD